MERIGEAELLGTYPFSHYRLENGLEVLLIRNPISPVAAYLTHFSVGSAQESDQQRGLAHFFEHMMFRETKSLDDGDFDRIIGESGGVGLNAYTSYDTTAYHVNVPSEMLPRVIELESDRMVNLVLSSKLIERERGAVLGEMQMYRDMPSEQLWNTVMATAFPAHPYRHPIIGYTDAVAAFTEPDFEGFYARHYAPNRALVVVAGQFDEVALIERIEAHYGGLPRGGPRPDDALADAPLVEGQRVRTTHDKISAESLVLAVRTPGVHHEDIAALQLLVMLLAGGQSAPLHRELVLGGIAAHASASLMDVEWSLRSPGLLAVEVGLQHGVGADQAEARLEQVLGTLAQGIEPGEFERAANQLRLSRFTGLRNNMSLARYLGGYGIACGDPLFGEQLYAAMARVSPEQVADVLRRYLIDAPRVVVVQAPGGEAAA